MQSPSAESGSNRASPSAFPFLPSLPSPYAHENCDIFPPGFHGSSWRAELADTHLSLTAQGMGRGRRRSPPSGRIRPPRRTPRASKIRPLSDGAWSGVVGCAVCVPGSDPERHPSWGGPRKSMFG